MAKKSIVKRIDRNLARRLREARKEVGLSVRAVSRKMPRTLAVSHTAIARYENGDTVPSINVLGALASIYHRPVNWFLDNRETLSDFRYRNMQSRVPLAAQRQYRAMASKWAEAYFALERHLQLAHPSHVLHDMDGRLPDDVASFVRTEYLNLDDSQPVVNTVTALESFSTWALELRATFGIDGASAHLGERPVVIMNPEVANERARLNAANELAYVLLSPDPQTAATEFERQAFTFASTLLLPDTQLAEAFSGHSFLKLIQFKERFGVSLAAMIHRAEQLRIINATASRWLRSQMVKRGWKRKEPGYVWRDRAITFEMMLESAIQTKKLTWEDAERIMSIPEKDLKERLSRVFEDNELGGKEEHPATMKLVR